MSRRRRRGRRRKSKRYSYIEVTGVDNKYVDAALLHDTDIALKQALSDEFKVLKKAGISLQDLRNDRYNNEELIQLVSPHLLENYLLYNYFVNLWMSFQPELLTRLFDDEHTAWDTETWNEQLRNSIEEEDVPIYTVINILRFYQNGSEQELIQQVLHDYAYQFYEETNIKFADSDIDWDELLANKKEDEMSQIPTSETDPKKMLQLATELIDNVNKQLDDIDDSGKYKELYEKSKKETKNLNKTIDDYEKKLNSRQSQIVSLQQEKATFANKVKDYTDRFASQQQEIGRLGQNVGELRKEIEQLTAANSDLTNRNKLLENEKNLITERTEKQFKEQFDSQKVTLQMDYNQKVEQLHHDLENGKKQLETKSEQYEQLVNEHEQLKKEIATMRNDLQVVIDERDLLNQQLQLEKQSKRPIVPEQPDEDDAMIPLEESDIDDFFGFANEPTKN